MSSIRKNIWDLDNHYDLTKSGQNTYYDPAGPFELWTVGSGVMGALGNSSLIPRSSPVQIPGTNWEYVSGNYNAALAIKNDEGERTLWSWGYNAYGDLGQNDAIPRSSPVQIGSDTTWSVIQGGDTFQLAIKTDGTLWSWGYNNWGMLGLNDRVTRSSPIQVGSDSTWSKIAGNRIGAVAIKTDGTLWVWGNNSWADLGISKSAAELTAVSSPVQLPGNQWNSVCHAYYSKMATKTDGTLWGWGKNSYGQLGLGDILARSSPTQIPGSIWSHVPQSQSYNTYAFQTDGTLWSMGGYAWYGRNGNSLPTLNNSSPVQLPGTQWSSMSSCYYVPIALKNDGTAWSWGYNSYGALGLGDRVARSSPTQIPGTLWQRSAAMGYTLNSVLLLKTPT